MLVVWRFTLHHEVQQEVVLKNDVQQDAQTVDDKVVHLAHVSDQQGEKSVIVLVGSQQVQRRQIGVHIRSDALSKRHTKLVEPVLGGD